MKCRNFAMELKLVTAGTTADAEFSFSHGLLLNGSAAIPRGYIVCRRGANASLYESGTAWTTTLAYFKCNVASAPFYVFFYA